MKNIKFEYKDQQGEYYGTLLEDFEDVSEFQRIQILNFFSEQEEIIKSGISLNSVDHWSPVYVSNAMWNIFMMSLNFAVQKEEKPQAMDVYFSNVKSLCEAALSIIYKDGGPAIINENGGMHDMRCIKSYELVEGSDVPSKDLYIDGELNLIMLENDPYLDKDSPYVDSDINYIVNLRKVMKQRNLKNYLGKAKENGIDTIFVFTTALDTKQMKEYFSIANDADFKNFNMQIRGKETSDIESAISYGKTLGLNIEHSYV